MFHRLEFRVHCHSTEEEEKVLKALNFVTGGAESTKSSAEGFHHNPIIVLTATLKNAQTIRAFWGRFKESRELEPLLDDLGTRIDEDGNLHLRLDKQEAFGGRLKVVRHDDIISMKGKVAAYPARREKAIEVALSYLKEV